MESILREIITEKIPGLKDEIYPTNAPESSQKPYLVYQRNKTGQIKTYEGFTDTEQINYVFNIMCRRYGEMLTLRNQIEKILKKLVNTKVKNIEIEDLDINNIQETYEHELKVNRGIIDFTIYFNRREE